MQMPRSNKRNEEDDEDDSVDVKTIKSLIKRTRSESDLKTLNVMLEKAKAEDREKKFAALKAKYSTGSGDATQYDDSLLDVVGVPFPQHSQVKNLVPNRVLVTWNKRRPQKLPRK